MNKAIVVLLAIVLCTGWAVAKDVTLEGTRNQTGDPAPSLSRDIQLTGTLDASSPTWNRAFNNDDDPSQNCDFQLNDSSQDGQSYDVFCITSTDENPVEIVINPDFSTLEDTVLLLYCAEWDAAQPLDFGVFYADDNHDVEGYSAFWEYNNVVMAPGQDYWLLISTYYPGDFGDFLIDCSDNVSYCGTVSIESTNWSSVKALFR